MTPRAEKMAQKRAEKLRFAALLAENARRLVRINDALRGGKTLTVENFFGKWDITRVDSEFVATCYPSGRRRDWLLVRSFHYHSGHPPTWETALGIAE